MSARPSPDRQARVYEIAVVGNDMLLAALPGRPVQLAHALLATGYDLVVPVSWGEELLAEHALRVLEQPGPRPLVWCACPRVRRRMLAAGPEMIPNLLSTVSPPVATARYLRALQPDVALRVTFLGGCDDAADPSIDRQVMPPEMLRLLEERGIVIARQPAVFDAMVPPDRRRHWSLPGGIPSPEALRERHAPVRLHVLETRDFASEVAEHLLAAEPLLLDLGPTVGCSCTGSIEVHQVLASREAVMALEPPRSLLPVVDPDPRVVLDHPIPVLSASRGGESTRPPLADTGTSGSSLRRHARLRAERKPIAVTPPGVGAVSPPARPATRPEATERRRDASPPPPAAPEPAPRPPVDLSASVEPVPTTPSLPAPPAAPDAPPAADVRTRRRTPAYQMPFVARAARSESGSPERRVPRAYGVVRPRVRFDAPVEREVIAGDRTAAGPTVPGIVTTEGLDVEVTPLEMSPAIAPVMDPASHQDPGPEALHQAAQRALRNRLRPLPPPEPANPRQLWGLLASVVLIAAVGVLLFVIFS